MAASPTLRGTPVELPRVLSARRARSFGLSRSAVRHGIARRGWQPLIRGVVLTSPDAPTRDDWALVGMELTGPRSALSGWDALRTVGLGDRNPPSQRVLVLDRGGEHRVAGGVRIRPTRRPYSTSPLPSVHPTLAFVPVVWVPRAIADTALEYRTLPPVRALVTTAIQRGRCRPEALVAELETGPRNGSSTLRRAIEDVIDGARSIAEAEAVDYLRRVTVPAFELNVPIIDQRGALIAVADVLWRELRAIAEIDSVEFHFGEQAWKGTGRRHNRLTSAGLALEHFPPSEIRTRRLDWARSVEDWLRRRAAELGLAYVVGQGPIRPPESGPPPLVLR